MLEKLSFSRVSIGLNFNFENLLTFVVTASWAYVVRKNRVTTVRACLRKFSVKFMMLTSTS
jgi:hypothetical protein